MWCLWVPRGNYSTTFHNTNYYSYYYNANRDAIGLNEPISTRMNNMRCLDNGSPYLQHKKPSGSGNKY